MCVRCGMGEQGLKTSEIGKLLLEVLGPLKQNDYRKGTKKRRNIRSVLLASTPCLSMMLFNKALTAQFTQIGHI